jgi:hypothetical protein
LNDRAFELSCASRFGFLLLPVSHLISPVQHFLNCAQAIYVVRRTGALIDADKAGQLQRRQRAADGFNGESKIAANFPMYRALGLRYSLGAESISLF